MSPAEMFALAVLVVAYALIISEKVHRTVAAMGGGVVILFFGRNLGIFSGKEIHFLAEAVDWNTIGLLMGMMIIVGILKDTGVFEFLAVKAAKISKGDPWRIILLFSAITAFLSAFLDNVTTVLLIAPVTISITRALNLNPVPYLISEVLASNIGGTATLIGDPPNIIIGSGAGLSFNDFIINLAPIVVIVYAITMFFFRFSFRDELSQKPENLEAVMSRNEWDEIRDYLLLKKSLAVMAFVIVLFFLHSPLGIEPATVAIAGAFLLLLLSKKHPDEALHQVEWSVLLFFAGLFVIVSGVERVGLLEKAANFAVDLTHGNLAVALFVILFVSALASAIVDNIPFTATMVPVIHEMSASPQLSAQIAQHGNPLWWALALGACLGGNGTLIGASANVVVAGISERMGYPITFKKFLSYGAPVTILSVVISGVILYVKTFIL